MAGTVSQVGNPHGLLGRIVGWSMARGHREFNRWIVQQLRNAWPGEPARIVELGSGPGVALQEILRAFPQAQVWGVDISPVMIAQSRRRNRRAVEAGRLTLLEGGVPTLTQLAPVDIVLAVHVMYFWREPVAELTRIHGSLGPGGLCALGFALRQDIPRMFERAMGSGAQVCDSEEELTALFREAGFGTVRYSMMDPRKPAGRLALAVP